jgi:IS4 transposase
VAAGDLMIGDRVYATRPSIFHVTQAGADVLVRFAISNLPMLGAQGEAFNVLEHLRVLKPRELGDWPVRLQYEGRTLPGRVCAVKKSRQAAERERRRLIHKGKKSGSKPRPETLEAAGYTFIFTTVALALLLPSQVLAAYRGRWQIEVVFKRLKSIMGLGHLRKVSDESTRAWIQGKLLVALLIQTLLRYADSFSPWGYPIRPEEGKESVPVA